MAKKKEYDKRILRLAGILHELDIGGGVSTSELAEKYNVTIRSIQRDIKILEMAGFPIYCTKSRYSFVEGYSLKKVALSKEEGSLLTFLFEISKSLGQNFERSCSEILKKVLYGDCDSPFYFKIAEGMKLDSDFPFVNELKQAIKECRKIELFYVSKGKEKWFRVDPLKIVFFDGFWYLTARVDDKSWIIKFRLDFIKELTVLNDYFEMPENLKTMLDESTGIWFSEKRDIKVTLTVSGEVAHYFKQKKYFPLQKTVKEKKDGSLVLESRASHHMEIMPAVFHWIPHVKVLSPKSLRDEVKSLVEEYVRGL